MGTQVRSRADFLAALKDMLDNGDGSSEVLPNLDPPQSRRKEVLHTDVMPPVAVRNVLRQIKPGDVFEFRFSPRAVIGHVEALMGMVYTDKLKVSDDAQHEYLSDVDVTHKWGKGKFQTFQIRTLRKWDAGRFIDEVGERINYVKVISCVPVPDMSQLSVEEVIKHVAVGMVFDIHFHDEATLDDLRNLKGMWCADAVRFPLPADERLIEGNQDSHGQVRGSTWRIKIMGSWFDDREGVILLSKAIDKMTVVQG